ncbi:MAG: fibrobacter succinogenes major paralogous domain-containing protein [Lentimicrobium sp.]|nr:fibrobacter succinogenes major paralogous domain-containing protein [Lentimicrobium sp.]
MKTFTRFLMLAALSVAFMQFIGCEPDEPGLPVITPVVPEVSTVKVIKNSPQLATIVCFIKSDGGAEISEAGICWRMDTATPVYYGLRKAVYAKKDTFQVVLNLSPTGFYHVRAFARNAVGLTYGESLMFYADSAVPPPPPPPPPPPDPELAEITSGEILKRTHNSAHFTASVLDTGYCELLEVGFCWALSGMPDINDYKVTVTPQPGEYSAWLENLNNSTDYIVRAYARNKVGVVYGAPINFFTFEEQVLDADGNVYYGVKIGNQVWLTESLQTTHFNNGDPITYAPEDEVWSSQAEPYYCWYNNDITRAGRGLGAIYNLQVVLDARGIAPIGYRLPTKDDIHAFGEHFGLDYCYYDQQGNPFAWFYFGGNSIRTGSDEWPSYLRGNNSTGFSAQPTGFRHHTGEYMSGHYHPSLGFKAYWWTISPEETGSFWTFSTGGGMANDHLVLVPNPASNGRAIRCLKTN